MNRAGRSAWLRTRLPAGELVLRPPRWRDGGRWTRARRGSEDYLRPWEALVPGPRPASSWDSRQTQGVHTLMVAALRRQARAGKALPFVLQLDGRYAGMLMLAPIQRGATWTAQLGYWVARAEAGQGVASAAVALAVDHAFGPVGLHRVEALVRPENVASRRVLERLGFAVEGVAREALYVDDGWNDHLRYAVVAGDVPGGLLPRSRTGRDTPR